MVNAECSTPYGGRCRCNPGHFQDGAKCFPLVPPGDVCLSSDQCVHNAVCTATLDGSKECEFSVVCVWGGGGEGLCIIGGSCQKYHFCCDKHVFVATDKSMLAETKVCFVATKDVFYRDKHVFVATKVILVAATANDSCGVLTCVCWGGGRCEEGLSLRPVHVQRRLHSHAGRQQRV